MKLRSHIQKISVLYISLQCTYQQNVSASTASDVQNLTQAINQRQLTAENLVYSVLAFGLTLLVTKFVTKALSNALKKSRLQASVQNGIVRITRYGMVSVGLILSLSLIGVNVAWISALLGFTVLILYMTVKPLVENMSAGLLLTAQPSFIIGNDVSIKDFKGRVIDINSRTTVIRTPDNRRVHIPNQTVLESPLVIYDAFDSRCSEISLKIASNKSINEIETTAINSLRQTDGVRNTPAPSVRLENIGPDYYVARFRWWHASSLGSESKVRDAVLRQINQTLQEHNIKIKESEA